MDSDSSIGPLSSIPLLGEVDNSVVVTLEMVISASFHFLLSVDNTVFT